MMRFSSGRQVRVRLAGLVFAGLSIGACGTDLTEPLIATSLVEVSGGDQELPAGGVESAPLVVGVLDQFGDPLGDVVVEWEITDGDGSLSASSSTSDAAGAAQVTYTTGDDAGDVRITATITGLTPVTFSLTVTPAT